LLNGFGFGADGHGFHDRLQQNQVNKKRNDTPNCESVQVFACPMLGFSHEFGPKYQPPQRVSPAMREMRALPASLPDLRAVPIRSGVPERTHRFDGRYGRKPPELRFLDVAVLG
jgi:hypothetical protein